MTEINRSGDIRVVRFGESNVRVQLGSGPRREEEEEEEEFRQLPESTLLTHLVSAPPRRSLLQS